MKLKNLTVLVLACVFLAILILKHNFLPSEAEILLRFQLGVFGAWLRVYNLIFAVLGLIMFFGICHRTKIPANLAVILLVFLPWYLYVAIFDLPGIFALSLVLAFYLLEITTGHRVVKIALRILMLVIFVANLSGTSILKEEKISLVEQSQLVDQRVRMEFKVGGYTDHVPLVIKRLVYNKYYFTFKSLLNKTGSIIDLEKWSSPGQMSTTITKSLWGSKNLSWIYFWLVVMAVLGIKFLNKDQIRFALVFFCWSIVSMFLTNGDEFLRYGVGVTIPVTISAAVFMSRLVNWQKLFFGLFCVWGILASMYHFTAHEVYWRDNRPITQMKMAEFATKYGKDKNVQVTTLVGQSYLYYAWLNQLPTKDWGSQTISHKNGNIWFDHFDLSQELAVYDIYIGFPGEFLGSRANANKNFFMASELPGRFELLDSFQIKDSLSYGNGDYIWAVRVHK